MTSIPKVARPHAVAIHWFRKGLRLHDNPALAAAAAGAGAVLPVFVLAPRRADPAECGARRYAFLLEALLNLDAGLGRRFPGQRLLVARGRPEDVLPRLARAAGATLLTYDSSTDDLTRIDYPTGHFFMFA